MLSRFKARRRSAWKPEKEFIYLCLDQGSVLSRELNFKVVELRSRRSIADLFCIVDFR